MIVDCLYCNCQILKSWSWILFFNSYISRLNSLELFYWKTTSNKGQIEVCLPLHLQFRSMSFINQGLSLKFIYMILVRTYELFMIGVPDWFYQATSNWLLPVLNVNISRYLSSTDKWYSGSQLSFLVPIPGASIKKKHYILPTAILCIKTRQPSTKIITIIK